VNADLEAAIMAVTCMGMVLVRMDGVIAAATGGTGWGILRTITVFSTILQAGS